MNKVPKIVCVSVLVCSNATLTDDAGPQSNKSYRSWFWQRQFLRSGHWRDRSEFTLCPLSSHRCNAQRMSGSRPFNPSPRGQLKAQQVAECKFLGVVVRVANDFHRRTIGSQFVGHDDMWRTKALHCFSEEFQCCFAVVALDNITFKHLTFVIYGPP